MTGNINAMDLITGLHSSRSPAFQGRRANDKTLRHLVNGLNVAGWIPLIGTIAGIARLIFSGIMYKNDLKKSQGHIDPEAKAFYTAMVMRGIVETLSLGILLVVQDIIFTVGRQIANPPIKQNNYSSQAYSPTNHNSSVTSLGSYSETNSKKEFLSAQHSSIG